MEPELWKAIQVLFADVEASLGPCGTDPAQDQGDDDIFSGPEELVNARSRVRDAFDTLRLKFSGTLTEQEAYQVLFPLVVYVDEQFQARYFERTQTAWPLLQKELYEVDDGGELFYDTLDVILKKPQTSQFVYEVHYFCLKHGFLGKYVTDPVRISKYMDQLKDKIAVNPMEGVSILAEDSGELKYFISPAWFYLGIVLLLVFVYATLRFLA